MKVPYTDKGIGKAGDRMNVMFTSKMDNAQRKDCEGFEIYE